MSFGTAYATKKRGKKMAKGGVVEDIAAKGSVSNFDAVHMHTRSQDFDPVVAKRQESEQDADMIARIMHKRKEYSQGGMVANDTGEGQEADELPNQFDDLVLRDELSDDSGAGNEHGDAEQDERDQDVVSKVMASRKKKDRMPRPS